MDKVKAYFITDIVFTPLYIETSIQTMDLNNSKSVWAFGDFDLKNDGIVFPSLSAGVFCPFVIDFSGKILKCAYNEKLVGITSVAPELDLLSRGIAIDSTHWDWSMLFDKRRALYTLNQVYGSYDNYKELYDDYPKDNSLLKAIISDAELEL